MSRKVEKAMGGLVQSLFGSLGSSGGGNNSTRGGITGLFGASHTPDATQPSLAFLSFLEKAQDARRRSPEAEALFYAECSVAWCRDLSHPSTGNGQTGELLQRALVAAGRGHVFPQLHIHAVKLTQATAIPHKKIGYVYLSVVCARDAELCLLVTNTLHKDLSSSDCLAVLTALAALPSLVTPDHLPPQLLHTLTNCIHHPMGLVRRRACQLLYAGLQIWPQHRRDMLEHVSGSDGCVAALLQLLSDPDPAIAVAATHTLAALYQCSPRDLCSVRRSVAYSAAHLLSQCHKLPQHYTRPPHTAPHVQCLLIRALRTVNRGDPWQPPPAVEDALTPVLTQVWGSGSAVLGMVLLEAVLLAMELHNSSPSLRTTAVNTITGFLRSSDSILQYAAVQAMGQHWPVFSDAVTAVQLHAVVHNLHHSNSATLHHATLHLLYTMANEHNYKSVIGTLIQYSDTAQRTSVQRSILSKVSVLLGRCAPDPVWSITALRPTLLRCHHTPELGVALTRVVVSGIERDAPGGLLRPCLSLVEAVLSLPNVPPALQSLAAALLVQVNAKAASSERRRARTVVSEMEDSPARHSSEQQATSLQEESVPSVAQSYCSLQENDVPSSFADDRLRTMLSKVNEQFIASVDFDHLNSGDDADSEENDLCVFECLKKIGLYSTELRPEIVLLAERLSKSTDLFIRLEATSVLKWLKNYTFSQQILADQQEILNNSEIVDWTLPFLEEYVNESLEKYNETPYVPFSVATMNQNNFANKSIVKADDSSELHNTSLNSVSNSCYSTPRTGLTQRNLPSSAFRTDHQPAISEHNFHSASPIAKDTQSLHSFLPDARIAPHQEKASHYSSLVSSSVGRNSDAIHPADVSLPRVTSTGSGTSRMTVSGSTHSSLTLPSLGDLEDDASRRPNDSIISSLYSNTAPKLLWSVDGRSPAKSRASAATDPIAATTDPEGIELGAEASEELQIIEDVPSAAATLAKAIYDGLQMRK